jgi:hypothetical protein
VANPHGPPHPWESSAWCAGTTRGGLSCSNREIRGVGWCLHHVPDELLELAEQIRGCRRCAYRSKCRQYAVESTRPPMCKNHGANIGSVQYRQAAVRVVEQRIAVAFAETLAMMRLLREARERAAEFERINGRPPGEGDEECLAATIGCKRRAVHSDRGGNLIHSDQGREVDHADVPSQSGLDPR